MLIRLDPLRATVSASLLPPPDAILPTLSLTRTVAIAVSSLCRRVPSRLLSRFAILPVRARPRCSEVMMRPFGFILFVLLPSVTRAQTDSGTIKLTYEILAGGRVSSSYQLSRSAGGFPLLAPSQSVQRGRRVAAPVRLVGCMQNKRIGTYTLGFDATIGPDGPNFGNPGVSLSLQVGGYPWDRSVRYAGAGTYPQHFPLGPKTEAKSWLFRPDGKGKRMWDQTINTAGGAASVTINPDERSGSFIIGPYTDRTRKSWTVRGTFECSRVMATRL